MLSKSVPVTLAAGCRSGDQPGNHQSVGERPEEAGSPFSRRPGPVPVGRLPGRHVRSHPAAFRLPYLRRQSPRDHRGTEEESCHRRACGAEEVRPSSSVRTAHVVSPDSACGRSFDKYTS